ncbi:unnamed protein product [Effrenium voratum]|uniref:Uncharacterized protein n=1 Tax=Effrenium voratum TaxID=2562239 RepID=A0AA36J597_9DINO|nr:unnamed protein product [Effrenium voratum]
MVRGAATRPTRATRPVRRSRTEVWHRDRRDRGDDSRAREWRDSRDSRSPGGVVLRARSQSRSRSPPRRPPSWPRRESQRPPKDMEGQRVRRGASRESRKVRRNARRLDATSPGAAPARGTPGTPGAPGARSRSPSADSRNSERPPGTWESASQSDKDRARRSGHYMNLAAQAMGLMHPNYMAMMQMGMMPHMMHMRSAMPGMMQWPSSRSRRPGASSSGSYSSSESSERAPGALWPMPMVQKPGPVEEFLKVDIDEEVADRLRAMPPHLQQEVMRRGPLDARSPTSSLLSRMKQAIEADRAGQLRGRTCTTCRPASRLEVSLGQRAQRASSERTRPVVSTSFPRMRPVKQSAKAAIEAAHARCPFDSV